MQKESKNEPWIKGRALNIFIGILMICLSLKVKLGDGEFYISRGFPVPRSTWLVIFFFGFCMFIFGLLHKNKEIEPYPNALICTSCYKLYNNAENKMLKCPECNGDIDLAKGFYTKKPDFIKRKQRGSKT